MVTGPATAKRVTGRTNVIDVVKGATLKGTAKTALKNSNVAGATRDHRSDHALPAVAGTAAQVTAEAPVTVVRGHLLKRKSVWKGGQKARDTRGAGAGVAALSHLKEGTVAQHPMKTELARLLNELTRSIA